MEHSSAPVVAVSNTVHTKLIAYVADCQGWVSAGKNLFLPHMRFKPAETWFKPAKTVKCLLDKFFHWKISSMSFATCTKLHLKSKIHIDSAMSI